MFDNRLHRPTIEGFTIFVRNVMGIPANYLPDDSPSLRHSLDHAIDVVNFDLAQMWSRRSSWSPYVQAVYNLGGHVLIEYAQDASYPLATLGFSMGVVSGTTSVANGLLPGDKVTLRGVSPLGYYGPPNLGYVVVQATPSNTAFSYNLPRDPGPATLLAGAAVAGTFFANARLKFKMGEFAPGVVASSSDVSTSVGLDNPDFMKGLTIEDLQLMKTIYGRTYLSIAQKYGPNVWGLS